MIIDNSDRQAIDRLEDQLKLSYFSARPSRSIDSKINFIIEKGGQVRHFSIRLSEEKKTKNDCRFFESAKVELAQYGEWTREFPEVEYVEVLTVLSLIYLALSNKR